MYAKDMQAWRPIALVIALVAAGINCWGVFEYGLKMEGKITYFVLGAPLVAIVGALLPPLGEWIWKEGQNVLACLIWVACAGCIAVIFFTGAERVHFVKAAKLSEQQSANSAYLRARENLKKVQDKLTPEVERKESLARASENCNLKCRADLDQAKAIRKEIVDAEADLSIKQSKATDPSQWTMPEWLLPATLDFIVFVSMWTALSGSWFSRKITEVRILPSRSETTDGKNQKSYVGEASEKTEKRVA